MDVTHKEWLTSEVPVCALEQCRIGTVVAALILKPVGRYCDWLRAARSGNKIPVRVSFPEAVETGSGTKPSSYTMGNESLPVLLRR